MLSSSNPPPHPIADKSPSKPYSQLSKKEKATLESSHKKMFSNFTREYDDKVLDLMYIIMPDKIKLLNDLFTKFEKESYIETEEMTRTRKKNDSEEEKAKNRKRNRQSFENETNEIKNEENSEKSSQKSAKKSNLDEKCTLEVEAIKRMEYAVPSNKTVVKVMKTVKRECLSFIKTMNTFKLWIQLNIPKIEDGNNFGVSVQEDVVTELMSKEHCAFTILEEMRKYFLDRAQMVRKQLKCPNLEDLRLAICEHDERALIMFRMDFLDLRNYYLTLLDGIKKNHEKLTRPRGAGAGFRAMF